jgi:hypothetical protein
VTQTQPTPRTSSKSYTLQGTLIEACSCRTLCRCWIGEDPDGGACDSFLAYHIDKGEINGVDVSGFTYVQVVTYVDARANDRQRAAMLDAWQGRLGGPLADLNALIGEDVAIETATIEHNTKGGEGTLVVGDKLRATMAPYRSAYGAITTLRDSIFSTIPGAPAFVAKASEHVVNIPEHGMVWTFKDRNAIQGDFLLEA